MPSSALEDRIVRAACPRCCRAVRVPAARAGDGPRCPACKIALLPGEPIELDDRSFGTFIAHSDIPVLVDFWAPWCGPCRTFGPVVAEAAAALSPAVVVVKVNTDASPSVAARFGIRSIPTIALIEGGREIARQSGAMPVQMLRRWLGSHGIDT